MKKILTAALLFAACLTANAQFEQGLKFVGAYGTGLDVSYSTNTRLRLGIGAEAGYMVADHIMAVADAEWKHKKNDDEFGVGVGGRYYVTHHGFYLGAGVRYQHTNRLRDSKLRFDGYDALFNPVSFTVTETKQKKYDDLMIPVEAGYSFYFNDYISIEPAVYYRMSLNRFGDGSQFGVKIGAGFYF